jgi:hypothetical protein
MSIWGALTSDLKDFVQTVAEDTATATTMARDGSDEPRVHDLRKLETDVHRSYSTYAKAPPRAKFTAFLSTFSEDDEKVVEKKAQLVDEEPDVCRHYMELVPRLLSPETFWARLFFQLAQLQRQYQGEPAFAFALSDDEDEDEEELSWDNPDDESGGTATATATSTSTSTSTRSSARDKYDANVARVQQLSGANALLKKHVKALTGRITELEGQLKAAHA